MPLPPVPRCRGFGRLFVALISLLLAGGTAATELTGLWLFDDSTDLGKATVGAHLAIVGDAPAWSASGEYAATTLTGVITTRAGSANRLLANHQIGANGGHATRTASYTLVYDIRCPAGTLRRSFYQTDLTNASGAEYFADDDGTVNRLGHPALNFTTSPIPQEQWVRLVISVQLGTSFTTYLIEPNGTRFTHAHAVLPTSDPAFSLDPTRFILFGDGNGNNHPLTVGQVAIFNGALSDNEVRNLGGPGTSISVPPWVVPAPVGWWQFDNPTDLTLATIGTNLGTVGTGFTAMPGIVANDGAVLVAAGNKTNDYLMTHGIPAGTGGGTKVNEYTLLFDVSYPTTDSKTFFQTDPTNVKDGVLFIDAKNKLGYYLIGGYTTSTTSPNTWNRVVFTVDNGTGRRLYVNGELWYDGNAGALNDRYSLPEVLRLFCDNDGDDGPLNVSNVAIWSSPLGAAQVAALGAAGAFISAARPPTPNRPPVIAEGETAATSVAMAVPIQFTFHATDADNDAIQWNISTPPAHGTAQITAGGSTGCTITYTSFNHHTGPDTLILSAADGRAADTIAVTLNVWNLAPVIAGGESYLLNAPATGGPRSATFTATDANANVLTWTNSPPQHGTAALTSTLAGGCQISYTPASGYLGADRFVVQVTDGQASDSVTVSVTVGTPGAEPVLTVISAHGSTTPAPGNHPFPSGTQLNPNAADEDGADTRYLCTGWTLTGDDGPATGTGHSFPLTLKRPAILTWLWRTQHRVVTAVNGNGSVSVTSGWQAADEPLQITATPAPGQYFAGWSGDTADCAMAGKNIVLPMTRPYGTITAITANFAADVDFTVIALPDTQNYSRLEELAEIFTGQTEWVINNLETRNIKFLTHLGDLVELATDAQQWTNTTAAMNQLDRKLPYGTCPGNHDLGPESTAYLSRFGPRPTVPKSIERWIDPATGQPYAWYGGTSPRGYSSYQTLRINGREFLFLHLDHDCPDDDMAWAKSVMTAHPQSLTMLTTHNYLAETGQRGYTSESNVNLEPKRNPPEAVFNELVKPFNQVYMVICGHMSAIYHLTKTNAAGNPVHEVLCDYQSLPNGGNGFLRIMEFSPTKNSIFNSTYSPTLGRKINPNNSADHEGMSLLHDPDGSEFNLDLDFDGRFTSTLTVASAHPAVNPTVGSHLIQDGTPLVVSAGDQLDDLTRRHPTGWSLTGAKPISGHGMTAAIVPEGDSTLTWSWDTEYWLDTAALGHGTVTIQDGWQLADSTVLILAEPDAGASFLQWGGDIAGCTVSGTTITVPMTRPRRQVTAVFSPTPPICTLTVVSGHPATRPPPGISCHAQGSAIPFSSWPSVAERVRQVPAGWNIAGTYASVGSTNSSFLTLTADAILTWSWTPEVFLELGAGLEGTILPLNAAGWKPLGTTVTLEARPAPGFNFVRWTGEVPANSTSPQLSLVMSQPRNVAADVTPQVTSGGTPHWWLDGHTRVIAGNYEAADLSDADRDGKTAHEEFIAGMCDLDPSQRFQVLQTTRCDDSSVLLTWTATTNRNYVVARSSDLTTPFVPVAGPIAGARPTLCVRLPAAGDRNFFRVEAVLPAATSFDGDSPAFSPVPASGSLPREMCRISTGWYACGDDSGGEQTGIPAHRTWVAGFSMDRFEVTRNEWEKVAAWSRTHGYDLPLTLRFDVPGNHPAVGVNWYDAVKWCNARSEMAGLPPVYHTDTAGLSVYRIGHADLTSAHVNWAGNGYRLPTEAEWERAARGGLEGQRYPWGSADALFRANHWDYAVFLRRAPNGAPPYTLRVGSFNGSQPGGAPAAVNAYGLEDMVGNAREWTWDRMGAYSDEWQVAPRGPDSGESLRVLRGGSWRDSVSQTTTSQRLPFPPGGEDPHGVNGFRCVSGLPLHAAP